MLLAIFALRAQSLLTSCLNRSKLNPPFSAGQQNDFPQNELVAVNDDIAEANVECDDGTGNLFLSRVYLSLF